MAIRWTGIDNLNRILDSVEKQAPERIGAALRTEGERIMTDSKRNYVPVYQGTLRASGHVQGPTLRRNSAEVTLGYGGAAAAYALVQHERTDYAHTVGQSKYLERPVHNAAQGFARRLDVDVFG